MSHADSSSPAVVDAHLPDLPSGDPDAVAAYTRGIHKAVLDNILSNQIMSVEDAKAASAALADDILSSVIFASVPPIPAVS